MGSSLGARQKVSQYVHPNGTYTHFRQFWRKWPKFLGEKHSQNVPFGCTYWHPILGAEAPTHTPKHIQVSCSNDNLPKRYSMWKKCNRNRKHLFQMHEYFSKIKFFCAWNALLHPVLRLEDAIGLRFFKRFRPKIRKCSIFRPKFKSLKMMFKCLKLAQKHFCWTLETL